MEGGGGYIYIHTDLREFDPAQQSKGIIEYLLRCETRSDLRAQLSKQLHREQIRRSQQEHKYVTREISKLGEWVRRKERE